MKILKTDQHDKWLKTLKDATAKARGMIDIARDAGISRESLYKSLNANGNPSFQTILEVTRALGLQISFASAKAYPARSKRFLRIILPAS